MRPAPLNDRPKGLASGMVAVVSVYTCLIQLGGDACGQLRLC